MENKLADYPFVRTNPMEPATELLEILKTGSAQYVKLFDGRKIWLVTNYNDVCKILASNAVSNRVDKEAYPKLSLLDRTKNNEHPSLLHIDGLEHRNQKTLLYKFFNKKKIDSIRPEIIKFAEELITSIKQKDQPVGLIENLTFKLPSTIICYMIGMPEGYVFSADNSQRTYIEKVIKNRHKELQNGSAFKDTIMDNLIKSCDIIHDLEDMISSIRVLLFGGIETLTSTLAFAIIHIAENPECKDEIISNSTSCRKFVKEVLRYYSVFDIGLTRAVEKPIELSCGTVMQEGEGVVVSLTAANRDSSVFESADLFKTEREKCPHLSFGHGPHFCIGHYLAIEVMEVTLSIFVKQFYDCNLSIPLSKLSFSNYKSILGPLELPMTWSRE